MPDNFKPTIWSAAIERSLKRKMVFEGLVNTSHDGEATQQGDTVKILGAVKPTVRTITDAKGQDTNVEQLTGTATILKIDQLRMAKYLIGDVDKAQSVPGFVRACSDETGAAMANETDEYIAGLYAKAGQTQTLASATPLNILASFFAAQAKLWKKDAKNSDIVAVLAPDTWDLIAQAVSSLQTDNSRLVNSGYMGTVRGVDIYMSNNISGAAGTGAMHNMIMTRKAIAYYGAISKVEKFRESDYLGDIVRAYTLFGADVIRAQELVDWSVSK